MTERKNLIANTTSVVVKVGTNVLADAQGHLDRQRIQSLADQIVRIRNKNCRVALVTSGAIGAGVGRLGLGKRPTELPELQACAAVGQTALMQLYQEALAPHKVHPAQILLTASDFDNRARYLNSRHTIRTLFDFGCLPIINENDTVSVAEIKFGDNDMLAAMVANLLQSPLLILLTNVDGLYSADPREDPSAKLVPTVKDISTVLSLAGATKSNLGTGGMKSKLKAARVATSAGSATIMANGSIDQILDRIFAGEEVGTLFLPKDNISAKKRWLGLTAQPRGTVHLDAGAVKAIVEKGKSLLLVGVKKVEGVFGKGDIVRVLDHDGHEVARGLSNYTSETTMRLLGKKADELAQHPQLAPYPEFIHRDHLAIVAK
jgi:glutamate 5-kinase